MKQPPEALMGNRLWSLCALLLCFASTATAQLPESALSVRGRDGKFTVWWNSQRAPAQWRGPLPIVAAAAQWRKLRPGLESAALDISGGQVGWRVRVLLARIDPSLVSLRLAAAVVDSKPAWNIEAAPASSVMACNAGQFESDLPWGWIVRDGREVQPPRPGPLSSALVVDASGGADLVDAVEISGARQRGGIVQAFQSYPAILVGDGTVPRALQSPGRGVDLDHRDSRLALGILPDRRLLIALTRFSGLGPAVSRLPFGPTTPEMAAIMGGLGCRRAVLLDGGLSGQLLLRDARGRTEQWPGLRFVPLGLIAVPRSKERPRG